LGLYRGGRSYDLVFETLAEQLDLPRRGREAELRAFVQRYAQRLEHYVRAYPYNWFNFYDFWKTDSTGHAQSVEPAAAVSGERG
ncbi:MAG: acyltransferase, partial [Xanthomonadales bacterium]|nr:acyltransferase [Xanthomonadales bacterium]